LSSYVTAYLNADGTTTTVTPATPLPTSSGGTPTSLGQKTAANSSSVVLASDQGNVNTTTVPSTVAAVGITPVVTTVAAGSLVLKASSGNLYSVNITSGASAGYLMLFNSTTAPADGTVTPIKVMPIAANAGLVVNFNPPIRFGTGITAVFSTTGPFSKTISATAFISGDVA